MNVMSAWRRGYSGKGVLVSVVDDGVDYNHPDLKSHYVSLCQFLFNCNSCVKFC